MKVSVIGLGKLGLCTAGCIAAKGIEVHGFDALSDVRDKLKRKVLPLRENGLPILMESAWCRLTIDDSIGQAVQQSDITLIIVPTPSDDSGRFQNSLVLNVLEKIGEAIRQKNDFHVVDVVSTVMPGSSEKYFVPILERLSGKRCGADFGFVYNPEFIALGSVIHDFLNPDMVLIGASDKRSADSVRQLYERVCDNKPAFEQMSLTSAEIAKLSLNCYVTMKISYANELASICEKVPGADIDDILIAIGKDSRVGGKYLKAGLGFGGPCFPRDNIAFQRFAEEYTRKATLGGCVVTINNCVIDRLVELVKSQAKSGEKIAIIGLAYKSGTHITEESQALQLARRLIEVDYEISLFDPEIQNMNIDEFREAVKVDFDTCIAAASVICIMDREIGKHVDLLNRLGALNNRDAITLIDPWRILHYGNNVDFRYRALGLYCGCN